MGYALLNLALPVVAGVALGLFYFGTLWLTVRRIQHSKHPQLLMVSSFWLRTGITVSGFYLVMAGSWHKLLAGVLGFLIMRQIMVKQLGPEKEYLRMKGFSR